MLHNKDDLSEFWRHLRRHDPVHWQPPRADGPGFWALTLHRDVTAVYKDHQRFTSERGNDFAREVAKEIPLAAICDLLGVPHADRERPSRPHR